jgi:hypothetical protein
MIISGQHITTTAPQHMVNYMGNWHLIAFCHLRNDWRDFVLGRMTLFNVEGTAFKIREKKTWQPFQQSTFGIFQNRKSFNVVRFTPERSRWIYVKCDSLYSFWRSKL